jgi:hypothetical protein
MSAALLAAASSARAEPAQICVEIPDAAPLDCLNAELAAIAEQAAAARQDLPQPDAARPPDSPTAAGLYNQTAMRIRMGTAFGVSVFPQRPTHYYTSPLPVMAPPP